MKKSFTVFLAAGLAVVLATVIAADASVRTIKRGQVVHMVAFKFKTEASSAQIKAVEDAFKALPSKIHEIVSFECGTNMSPEKLDKGFTHGFVLTFKNDKDRDAYLVHPDHKAFGGLVGPVLGDVFVLDFVTKD
jgi:hypothetical protein